MNIRKTTFEDLSEILKIYEHARQFMRENNNPNQWGTVKPAVSQVENDIQNSKSYVCINDNNEIVGVFYFSIEEDPTYNYIEGKWLNDDKYGVIHRIAVKENTKGIGTFCINWAYEKCHNLKIDTHENNIPMRSLLKKIDFKFCGIIYLLDGNPRNAYQESEKIERK